MTALKCRGYGTGIAFFVFQIPVFALAVFLHTECSASEYQEKVEFVCGFAKFVQWPQAENTNMPLQICILGKDTFGTALENLKNKTVRGRRLSFRVSPDAKGTEDCHIVFVSASEKDRLPEILSRLSSRPVLTVGDFPGFAAQGGMINLIHTGDRLCFEINTDAALQSGLQISSQLLKLARAAAAPSEKDNPQ